MLRGHTHDSCETGASGSACMWESGQIFGTNRPPPTDHRSQTKMSSSMARRLVLRSLAQRAATVRLASSSSKAPLVEKSLAADGILTIRFTNEKKVRQPNFLLSRHTLPTDRHIAWLQDINRLSLSFPLFLFLSAEFIPTFFPYPCTRSSMRGRCRSCSNSLRPSTRRPQTTPLQA